MTLSILLILFAIAVAGIFLYALLNLFHVVRFGHMDAATYFMTGAFIAGFVFILFVSYTFIRQVNWSMPIISISNNINTGF